jgi:predicted alpha/beta-hydrolase family hydrolase
VNVVLLPGFNGAARQPILARLASALGAGATCFFPGLPRGRPSPGFGRELAFLHDAIANAGLSSAPVLVGRSFGGRVAVRSAALHPTRAVVLLGFPVRPPGRPRPEDEAALLALRVPTLVVQGDADDKGPLEVLAPLVQQNRSLSLVVLPKTGHQFGRAEAAAVDAAVAFLKRLPRAVSRRRRRV